MILRLLIKRSFRSSPIRFSPIIGEITEVILAKVHLTFAKLIILRQSGVELIIPNVSQKLQYWRKFSEYIGESILDVCQVTKVPGVYWRKYTGCSPIGESSRDILAKV
jgi:hypothetical protein